MSATTILSWDCGLKTLAMALISIYSSENGGIEKISVDSLGVFDLAEGAGPKSVAPPALAAALKKVLKSLPPLPPGTIVVVERQSATFRGKTPELMRRIESQLLYEFAEYPCHLCNAGLKNKLSVAPGLERSAFPAGYGGNKKHATASAVFLGAVWGFAPQLCRLTRQDLPNAADAVMQGLAWFIFVHFRGRKNRGRNIPTRQ